MSEYKSKDFRPEDFRPKNFPPEDVPPGDFRLEDFRPEEHSFFSGKTKEQIESSSGQFDNARGDLRKVSGVEEVREIARKTGKRLLKAFSSG